MRHCDVYLRKNGEQLPSSAYDKRVLTKLLYNYRSHPAILKVPNECFYENELEAHADQLMRESLCQWAELPVKGFPIIFHGVVGKDTREERSPSFFNPEEVVVVIDYVQKLMDTRGLHIRDTEIGIISPYRRQVKVISNDICN